MIYPKPNPEEDYIDLNDPETVSIYVENGFNSAQDYWDYIEGLHH